MLLRFLHVNRRALIKDAGLLVSGLALGSVGGYLSSRGETVQNPLYTTVTRLLTQTQTITQSPTPRISELRIGFVPNLYRAPIYMGEKYGVFARYGLNPTRVEVPAGSGPSIEALISGTVDITSIDWVSVLKLAESRGIHLKVVHNWLVMGSYKGQKSNPNHGAALIVKKDSKIEKLEQLKGKKVAINALNALPHMSLSILLNKVGVNPSKDVEWVEVAFNRMPGPLSAGQVDAAVMIEPFLTLVISQDIGRAVVDPPVLPYPNLYLPTLGDPLFVTGYFTSEQIWNNKREAIRNTVAALADCIRYMYGDIEDTIKTTAKELNVNENIVEKALSGGFFVANPEGFKDHKMLDNQVKALTEIGFLQKEIDTSKFALEL